MKNLWFGLLLFCCSLSAQTTTVTATVVDSDGQSWNNGTWSLAFTPNPAYPNLSSYLFNGVPLNQAVTSQNGTMNGSGTLGFSVYQNGAVFPAGSTWTITVCPQATAKCSNYNFSTSLLTTLNISSSLNSLINPPRFPAVYGNYGYLDVEANTQLIPGASYYNVTSACQRVWSGTTWGCSSTGSGVYLPITGGTLTGAINGPGLVRSIISDGASTGSADNSTAINATIAAVATAGGGEVFIPRGTFNTTRDIVVSSSNIHFVGEGKNSIIHFNPGVCPCTNGVNHEAFFVAGTLSNRRQVAAAVAVGATSFQLASSSDGTDLTTGEWLIVEEYDAGAAGNEVVSTWVQVLSVSGTTVNVVAPFKTAIPHLRTWSGTSPYSGSSFYAVTGPIQGTTFKDLNIVVGLPTGLTADVLPGIYLAQGTRGTTADNVQIDDAAGDALAVFLASDFHVNNFRSYSSRIGGIGAPEIASTSGFSIVNSLFANYYTTNSISPASQYSAALDIDNGSEDFAISTTEFENGGAISLELNTAVHNCSITGNNFGWTAQSPGSAIAGIGVQNCTITGNTGSGGAGYGVDLVSSPPGWSVAVPSQGNVVFGNAMNNYTGGAINSVNATATDTYLTPGQGYWAMRAPNFLAAGLSYGSSSSNADGKLTLMDSSNNTVLENTGGNQIQFKVNGALKGYFDPNGFHTGLQLYSTVATGTPPFVVSSITPVANLNASLLLGGTWAAPQALGSTTPANADIANLVIHGTCTGCGSGVISSTLPATCTTGQTWGNPAPASILDGSYYCYATNSWIAMKPAMAGNAALVLDTGTATSIGIDSGSLDGGGGFSANMSASPTAGAGFVTITFGKTYTLLPKWCNVWGTNAATVSLASTVQLVVQQSDISASNFVIRSNGTPIATGVSYHWGYACGW